jgi:flagellin
MPSGITLSKGIRSNLLQLQNTASLTELTQGRLATGKRVNSALDNPTNFFTSSTLNARANDLSSLLDSLSNGVKTLEQADNALTSITKNVEQMQSVLRQARQDKSYKNASYTLAGTAGTETVTFTGGQVSGTVSVDINKAQLNGAPAAFAAITAGGTLSITSTALNGGSAVNVALTTSDTAQTAVDKINSALSAASGGANGYQALVNSLGGISIASTTQTTGFTLALGGGLTGGGLTAGASSVQTFVRTTDQAAAFLNNTATLSNAIRATNDNGKLRIENLSTADLTVGGTAGASGVIGGNDVRKNLVTQFNDLRQKLDQLADDASFNGINLLRGDKLKLSFNENNTSTIEIQAKDTSGKVRAINSANLSIDASTNAEFQNDDTLDAKLGKLQDALNTLRSQASAFGTNLSVVQNRTEFTKATINTLKTGADALVLADQNEEAANLLALQTRQQLASTALSLANQADQGVLRLF